MPGVIHIGDLARATGRTVHTIRWYERQGLMPGVVRNTSGRRTYHPDHIEWLRFLDRLRFTGMTIKEMRTYADLVASGHRSLGERQKLLQRHRAAINARIGELTSALDLIDEKIAFYGEWEIKRKRPAWRPKVGDHVGLARAARR